MVYNPRLTVGQISPWSRQRVGSTKIMNTYFSEIDFARPYFLWLLFLLAVFWSRFRDRRLVVSLARRLILALVIFTLADPQTASEESRQEERIFAYDVSAVSRLYARVDEKNGQAGPCAQTIASCLRRRGRGQQQTGEKRSTATPSAGAPEKTNLENLFKRFWRCPQGRAVFTYLLTVGKLRETLNVFYRPPPPRESRFIPYCLPSVQRLPMSQ